MAGDITTTVPADGDGVSSGVLVSELAGHQRAFREAVENRLGWLFSWNGSADAALAPQYLGMPNVLINGCMRFWQRGTSFTSATTPANSDDTYLADRWVLLSDGDDIVDVTQETSTVPTGFYSAMKLDVETADKKFMVMQPVETRNADPLVGGVCSLSFYARAGDSNATVDHLRAAVLSWDSTADTITSDVVSAWGAEGTNPTWATNWTMENTPTDLNLTTSYQRFTIENVSIDTASTANIAVVIWCDNADPTVGDLVYITGVKLEYGSKATPFIHSSPTMETARCQRYYWRGEPCDVNFGAYASGHYASWVIVLPVQMRTSPSAGIEDSGATYTNCGSAAFGSETIDMVRFLLQSTENNTNANVAWGANDYLYADAEL